jgi:hypothetical protein
MMIKTYALLSTLFALSASPATAATFTATAEGNTVTIFSKSDKVELCDVYVHFSYWYKGKREYTVTHCPNRIIVISDKAKVCNAHHVEIVNPKIEGSVVFECE